ncbi:hypothetical protein Tco_0777871 [Tanacetum coccineum]
MVLLVPMIKGVCVEAFGLQREGHRKRKALQAKRVESFKASKTESSNALRSKTPTQRLNNLKEAFHQQRKICQKNLLRKYDKIGSSVKTPITPSNMLGPDLNGKAVNESQYREVLQMLVSCLNESLFVEVRISSNVAMFSAEAEDIAADGCCAIIL